jgi:nucleoside-diphosphate-sugar epimerase
MAQFTVLGASGFVGGSLATRLADAGHQVYRPSRGELSSLGGRQLGHVFYCLGVDDAPDNPYGAFESHVAHAANILRFCAFSSMTYLSSTRVYLGARSSREDAELLILPDDGNAIYNATKIAGEQICLAAKNPTVRVVRLSNVLGYAPNSILIVPMLIKNAIKYRKIQLTISPQSSKDYIAIEDVVDLLPRIALEGKLRCYNVASGINVKIGDIVPIIRNALPSDCEWCAGAPTTDFPPIDIGRIQSEFSFTPRPPIDAVASTCSQFRLQLAAPAGVLSE